MPFLTVALPRLVRRTQRRRMRREQLWNGNVEPPLRTFFTDKDHLVRWAWRARHKFDGLVPRAESANPELVVVRLGSTRELNKWLAQPVLSGREPAR